MPAFAPTPPPPIDIKTMMFIDGSNLLVQMHKKLGVREKMAYKPSDAALNLANTLIDECFRNFGAHGYGFMSYEREVIVRRYWIGSYQGTEEDGFKLAQKLRFLAYEPVLFKQVSKGKEKGVDIALAKEMLVNAFQQNTERSYLIAEDADYVSLVDEVKRYGQQVRGMFFEDSTAPRLKVALDHFWGIGTADNNWMNTYPGVGEIKASDKPEPWTIKDLGSGI